MCHLNLKYKFCRPLFWLFAIPLICTHLEPSVAFVNLIQTRAHLIAARRNSHGRTTCADLGFSTWQRGFGRDNSKFLSTEISWQRNRAQCVGIGHCSAGVGSLRASLDLPPMAVADVVQFVGRQLQEQSVKHHWQSGFIGGSVGVVGTLTAIQLKINQVKELTSCPYCRSTGQLACATCFGMGSVSIKDTLRSTGEPSTVTLTCPCCSGKTYITCVNCRGDGRGVPLFLNKKASRDPESEIEDVGYA